MAISGQAVAQLVWGMHELSSPEILLKNITSKKEANKYKNSSGLFIYLLWTFTATFHFNTRGFLCWRSVITEYEPIII